MWISVLAMASSSMLSVMMAVASALITTNAFSPSVALVSSVVSSSTDKGVLRSIDPFTLTLQSTPTNHDNDITVDGKPLINNKNKSILNRLFNSNKSSTIIRGSKYENSTILTPADAANTVNVKPTREATKQEWQRAWKLHRFMMKILHKFDGCKPKDSKLALACLWWKAIAGNDRTSPVYDYQLSYDLLPSITRWIVNRRICRFYPRLHHANVEIRKVRVSIVLSCECLCSILSLDKWNTSFGLPLPLFDCPCKPDVLTEVILISLLLHKL